MSEILKNDRVVKYFDKYLKSFLFVEFSDEFMQKLKIDDIAKDVKVPIMPKDLENFAGGEGISATKFAENMVWVVGCNPNFKYADAYREYMARFFDKKLAQDVLMVGVNAVKKEDFLTACIHFRAALFLEPDMMEALYNYARVCREIYAKSDDEEYIGRFKAESIEAFEELTIKYPDFEQAYYFLGYAYLNMGLYEKAGLTWEKYMPISKDPQGVQEIAQRLREIAEPRKIEEGCNAVISGKYQEGLSMLLGFLSTGYETWWPLHFYLATAYEELGNDTMAINEYKRTLQLNAASFDAMEGLVRLYEKAGDKEMADKYAQKIEIIKAHFEEDAE